MNTQMRLLLDILYDEPVSEETKRRIIEQLPSHMPEKGEGRICVDNVETAESILKDHVGEFEWGYYPNGAFSGALIRPKDSKSDCYYGKFEIEDLKGLWEKLITQGVRIYDIHFFKDSGFPY